MRVLTMVAALVLAQICLLFASCSWDGMRGSFRPEWRSTEPETPRSSASLQLTQQGKELLEGGYVDDAISVLERSMGLDPANGRNYYYLSEAWLQKGNIVQAEEFNGLAELYLKDDPEWGPRAAEQRRRLKTLQEWPRD